MMVNLKAKIAQNDEDVRREVGEYFKIRKRELMQ